MMRSVRRAVVAAGAVALVLGTGAGVAAAAPQVPVLAWTPPGPVFGTLVPGDTASQAFTLTNTSGPASSQLTISVTPASAYTIKPGTDTCTGKSLGQNKSCTVTVIFTAPAAPGSYPGTLTATGAKPNVTATVNLAGQSAKATPSISTSPQPAAGLLRTIVSDQATVTGGDNPGGTVTFVLYRAPDCSPNSQLLTSANVPLVNGTATSAGTQLTTAGTYYWQVTYHGDNDNNSVTTGCGEPVVIGACAVTSTASGQAFPDLQDAVTAASSGDTLTIEGTCTGTTTISKSLTLTGQATASTPAATLDGGQQGSVLTINNGGAVTLNSLIITGGFTQVGTNNGGGIWFDGGGTLTVNNSTITNNAAIEDAGSGGAIASTGGTVTVNSSTITDNRAGLGGGIEFSGGTMTLNDTTIGDNPTTSGGGNTAFDGGGIYIAGGTLNLVNGDITDNTATQDGGGIYYQGGAVNLSPTTNISGNQPDNCTPATGTFPGC